MRNRIEILNDLIQINGNISEIQNELSKFSWDVKEPILIITKTNISDVLKRCVRNGISINELENWANIIECRDDLDFENEDLKEFIFELANSDINGKPTKARLMEIINSLYL